MEVEISVSVVVFRDESILFVKDTQTKDKHRLVLPGGRLQGNERIEECAVRIARETSGIAIELDRNLGGIIANIGCCGNYPITFVLIGEAVGGMLFSDAVFLRYRYIERYGSVSDFSGLVIRNLKDSTFSSMVRSEFVSAEGDRYRAYF